MDLDGRLGQLTPLALDTNVDLSSNLWREYKEAKDIRNKVVHHSHATTKEEATQVLKTVEKWLAYLGANAEVDFSLFELKHFLEEALQNQNIVATEHQVVRLITDFYSSNTALLEASSEADLKGYRADLILDFGEYKTLFEVKGNRHLDPEQGLLQLDHLYNKLINPRKYRLVLLMLTDREIPQSYDDVMRINDHTTVVFIRLELH